MAIHVHKYAAQSVKTQLIPHCFERNDPCQDDMVIKILYCGVCHTDLYYVGNEWGAAFTRGAGA